MRLSSVRVFGVLSCIIGIVLMTAGAAFAQATSTINGRVLDQGDAVLPGVTVTVTNQNTGVMRTTTTNDEGVFSFTDVRVGSYTVTTERANFKKKQVQCSLDQIRWFTHCWLSPRLPMGVYTPSPR